MGGTAEAGPGESGPRWNGLPSRVVGMVRVLERGWMVGVLRITVCHARCVKAGTFQ